jgi:hypothetical protein
MEMHVLQARAIKPLDAVRGQQVAIRDHAGDCAPVADANDQVIQIRMQERLTAAERYDACAQICEKIDAPQHFRWGNRLGKIVEFIAISARQIASPRGNDVGKYRVVGRPDALEKHEPFAGSAAHGHEASSEANSKCRHIRRKHY